MQNETNAKDEPVIQFEEVEAAGFHGTLLKAPHAESAFSDKSFLCKELVPKNLPPTTPLRLHPPRHP